MVSGNRKKILTSLSRRNGYASIRCLPSSAESTEVRGNQSLKVKKKKNLSCWGGGDPGVFSVEDYLPPTTRSPRKYQLKWKGYEERTWEPEDNVEACMLVDWFKNHPDEAEKCELDMKQAKEKRPRKIKTNNMFIRATQNALTETFLPQNIDGDNLNTRNRTQSEA